MVVRVSFEAADENFRVRFGTGDEKLKGCLFVGAGRLISLEGGEGFGLSDIK